MKKIKLQIEKNKYTYLYKWTVKNPIAVLNLIHGSKEHIKRYEPLITFLNKQGISVYGMDLRGHGVSAFEQDSVGHIESYKNIITDIDLVNNEIKKDYPGVKVVLYGHSMGSFILRYYLMFNKEYSAIICGTNEQDRITTHGGLMVARITKLFKGKQKFNKLIDSKSYKAFDKKMNKDESWISNNYLVWKEFLKDDVNIKSLTNETFISMLSWLREIRKPKAYKNQKGKILIIAGDRDPVGRQGRGPKKVYKKFIKHGANTKLKLYKDGHHEVHNDKNKLEVFDDIATFIKEA